MAPLVAAVVLLLLEQTQHRVLVETAVPVQQIHTRVLVSLALAVAAVALIPGPLALVARVVVVLVQQTTQTVLLVLLTQVVVAVVAVAPPVHLMVVAAVTAAQASSLSELRCREKHDLPQRTRGTHR